MFHYHWREEAWGVIVDYELVKQAIGDYWYLEIRKYRGAEKIDHEIVRFPLHILEQFLRDNHECVARMNEFDEHLASAGRAFMKEFGS